MAVSKRLRYEVLRRDNHACRYCGATAPDAKLTVDHVVPTALGGTDDPSNLVAACADCNSGKSSSSPDAPLVDDVAEDALRWSRALQRAALAQAADRERILRILEWFDERWARWTFGVDERAIPRGRGWEDSVERFIACGLDPLVIDEAIDIAMRSKAAPDQTWRYFCGVCWRRLEELREAAKALIDADETEAAGGA